MAVSKKNHHNKHSHQSYISVHSQIISSTISQPSLESLLHSPKKKNTPLNLSRALFIKNLKLLTILFIFAFTFFYMLKALPFSQNPCFASPENLAVSKGLPPSSSPPSAAAAGGFWEQPDGMNYRPCLDFSEGYIRESTSIVKDRTKYLMVVVAGGLNQQRNQIVDAVVIARILGAALVVPNLQVNVIWGDDSEFADIFDLDHFKNVLAGDVRVVSSLPSTHLMTRPVEVKNPPLNASPEWIKSNYVRRIRRDGILLLRGLDSRLSKDLPSDLQKLRCKVAFHALRFAPQVSEIGGKILQRMRDKGPFLALHLRMEKDVWVRTGCLPGLKPAYDDVIEKERRAHPRLLTSRSNMTYVERKLAGLCPLTAVEVARLLRALGATKDVRIYWAGGIPFGGKDALRPLTGEFPHLYNKDDLATKGELEPFSNKASLLAAIDYIVCEESDVFMASHGGNMGHAIQGKRAYSGHKKTIIPNKRQMLSYFMDRDLPEPEFDRIVMGLHADSFGQPEVRKSGRDVTKYPMPECMCNNTDHSSS